jgi:hypothetical protein
MVPDPDPQHCTEGKHLAFTCCKAHVVGDRGVPDETHVLRVALLLLVNLHPEADQVLPVFGEPVPEPYHSSFIRITNSTRENITLPIFEDLN